MSYFTESQLEGYANSNIYKEAAMEHVAFSDTTADVSIFLSHSHKDQKKAEGLQIFLASLGVDIYIDWQDASMPKTTNRQTANKIKDKIAQMDFFWVLATKNSMLSRWVPWEIGIADEKKADSKIMIIPVEDPSGKFHGNEYLQLYQRIIFATNGNVALFEANKNENGKTLKSFLSDFQRPSSF